MSEHTWNPLHWHSHEWVAFHGVILFSIIFNVVCLIYFHRLWKLRNDREVIQHLKIRHKILFYSHTLVNYYWIAVHPTVIAVGIIGDVGLPLLFCSTYFVISLKLLIWCNRMWRLYYNYSFHSLQIKMIWKKHLNSKHTSFLLKYPKLGRLSYVFSFTATLMFLFDIILFWVAKETNFDQTFHFCIALHFFLWVLVLNFLGIRLHRKHNVDNYHIRTEFSYLCLLFSTDFGLLVVPYFVVADQYLRIWIIIDGLAICNLVMMIITIKLISKNGNKNVNEKQSPNKAKLKSVTTLLTDSVGLNAFAEWLVGEFSVESLLFIIEVCQFRKLLKEYIRRTNTEYKFDETGANYFELPQNIPLTETMTTSIITDEESKQNVENKSNASISNDVTLNIQSIIKVDSPAISTKNVTKYNFHLIACKIYKKFIEDEYSDLSVNISFQQRQHLQGICNPDQLERKTELELFTVFDEPFVEILRILRDPLVRFQKTFTYRQWVEQCKSDGDNKELHDDISWELKESIDQRLHLTLFNVAVCLEKQCSCCN